jgi:hypothetical protein
MFSKLLIDAGYQMVEKSMLGLLGTGFYRWVEGQDKDLQGSLERGVKNPSEIRQWYSESEHSCKENIPIHICSTTFRLYII